jgi:hypothetical protein
MKEEESKSEEKPKVDPIVKLIGILIAVFIILYTTGINYKTFVG